MADVSQLT